MMHTCSACHFKSVSQSPVHLRILCPLRALRTGHAAVLLLDAVKGCSREVCVVYRGNCIAKNKWTSLSNWGGGGGTGVQRAIALFGGWGRGHTAW